DLAEALLVALRLNDVGDPAIALASGACEGGVGATADPDGRGGLLRGLGIDAHALELREAALEGGGRGAPARAHDVDALARPRPALAVRGARGFELFRVLPAHPDSEDQPAPGERVEGGGDLGRDGRMAEGEEVHTHAETGALGDADVGREQSQRL